MWQGMNNSGSRMYSINLAAFVMEQTHLVPDVLLDAESNTAYFVFPECSAVSAAIRDYKQNNPEIKIHDFLGAIKKLRTTMAAIIRKD